MQEPVHTGFQSAWGAKLARVIQAALVHASTRDFCERMVNQYRLVRLLDHDGQWATPELQAASTRLLPTPSELTRSAINRFVDEIGELIDQNPYLSDALSSVADTSAASALAAKVQTEGDWILPQVIAYGMVLDRLTAAMAEDWRLLQSVTEHWDEVRRREGVVRQLIREAQPFELAKLYSVLGPIRSIIEFHEQGRVDPGFLDPMLSVNINEAVAADVARAHFANAEAGLVLAEHGPGHQGRGAGFTANREIRVWMPAPERWADLYQTWNLAFVSHYPRFPFVMVKLAIPAVAGYHDEPETYIARRAIALHVHLHVLLLGRTQASFPGADMDWYDPEFTKAFGRANARSARAYELQLGRQVDSGERSSIRVWARRRAYRGARWLVRRA